jgi:hypothetical protein
VFARHVNSTSTTSLQTELSINHTLSTTLPEQRPATEPEDLEVWAMAELVNRIRLACESPQLKVTIVPCALCLLLVVRTEPHA